jgi:hypothetical protein
MYIFIRSTLKLCRPESRKPLGRPRGWWVNNIRMDLREIGWEDVDWMHLAQDRD